METKTKSIRLLTLALIATVMTFGAAAARATVISGTLSGCVLVNVSAGQNLQTSCASGGATGNLFGAGASKTISAVDGAVDPALDTEAEWNGVTVGKWTITADVDTDGTTRLVVKSSTAQPVVAGTHFIFALDLDGEHHLDGFDDVVASDAGFLKSVNRGILADGKDWWDVSVNDGFSFAAGQTVTLSATLRTVPEPGSLALLGAVVLAIGVGQH